MDARASPANAAYFIAGKAWLLSLLCIVIMLGLYLPTLHFYALNKMWALSRELEINKRPILGSIFVRIQGVVTGA